MTKINYLGLDSCKWEGENGCSENGCEYCKNKNALNSSYEDEKCEVRTKQEAIKFIKSLYPPNSGFSEPRKIGKELLIDALYEEWESLPDGVIYKLAALCEEYDKKFNY